MPDSIYKRMNLPIPGFHVSKSSPSSPSSPSNPSSSSPLPSLSSPPFSLHFIIESPPLMFLGNPASSTGALLSGQLRVVVSSDSVVIDSFTMRLAKELTRKRPIREKCPSCTFQSVDLANWNFHRDPATLHRGQHDFPFSFLLPGTLMASMQGVLSQLAYFLRASLVLRSGEVLDFSHILDVKRALYSSGAGTRESLRTFPPTNLIARCQLPPLLFPIGVSNIELRVDGLIQTDKDDAKIRRHWKLSRILWRIEESETVISPPCPKHISNSTKDGKIEHHHTRTLQTGTLSSGWKSDYISADGYVHLEFQIGNRPDIAPVCNMKSDDGTLVTHALVIEMTMDEYTSRMKHPTHLSPTSRAQVMRIMFDMIVTERSGLGISWDEEQPPLYEQVPPSPPAYANTEVTEGGLASYENLLSLEEATANPSCLTHGELEGIEGPA